jgi:glycosyltransferase involved in cell wall biosynthesis
MATKIAEVPETSVQSTLEAAKPRRIARLLGPEASTATAVSVVYFVPQLSVGGTENHLADLVLRLHHSQFRPAVWCPGPWGPAGDRLLQEGIGVCRIRLSPRRPISFLRAIAWLRAVRPQIFHSFGYGNHWLDVFAARLAGVPVILTSRRNVRHWDSKQRLQWGERLRNRWTNLVVANANAPATVCANVEGFPPDRIQVIYNGVNLGPCHPNPKLRRALRLGPTDLLVGNVANLKHVKRHDVLIRALRQVVDELPPTYLVICGEGEQRPALERLCRELGLLKHVFFLGLRHDLESIYRSLDLYVHSSCAEGLSNSVLEAMAHRVPVVATSVGGTCELLAGHAEDCLVPPGDVSALAKAMLRMLRDEALRSHRGLGGQRSIADRFTVSRMVAEHESLYLTVLRRKAEAKQT